MHSPPARSDGKPDAECDADSAESLAGSAITPAGAEPSDDRGDSGVISRVGDVPGDSGTTWTRSQQRRGAQEGLSVAATKQRKTAR